MELTPNKKCPYHHRGLECKSRKSRGTWSDRQVWPWSTNEARHRLIKFFQENALVIANILLKQHKRRLYRRMSPNSLCWCQIDSILGSNQRGEAIYSQQKPGLDCGSSSDHQLLMAKCRLKLNVAQWRGVTGQTTRPAKYKLNQIPSEYAVEVTNSFKGLDLVKRVPQVL